MEMFKPFLKNQLLFIWLLLIVVLSASYYLVLGNGAVSTLEDQVMIRQQVVARAEAENIKLYFQKIGTSVAVLSRLSSITKRNKVTEHDMDVYIEQRSADGLIAGLILTDKNGVVQYNSNIINTRDVGTSVHDRDYFIWARDQGKDSEYFFSKPYISRIGASKGQQVIVVASPVYNKGEFDGVLAASVKLTPLVERFFGLLKSSSGTETLLIDNQGVLLYSSKSPEAVGKQFSEYFSDNQDMRGLFKDVINTSKEGKVKINTHLVTYSRLTLGSQDWLLLITLPVEEVKAIITPFYIRLLAIFVLTSFTILLFGVLASRKSKV